MTSDNSIIILLLSFPTYGYRTEVLLFSSTALLHSSITERSTIVPALGERWLYTVTPILGAHGYSFTIIFVHKNLISSCLPYVHSPRNQL